MGGGFNQVNTLTTYLSIFDKKVEGIILDLRKKTFEMQAQGSEEEDDEEKLDAIKEED